MDKNQIMEVLLEWNFWKKDIGTGIERTEYLGKLNRLLETDEVITVTGIRRCGKSTLMLQYMKTLIESGIPKQDLLFINLEDARFGSPNLDLMLKIYDVYKETLKPQKKPYIFLDEIQKIDKWEKFVRTLHDKKEAHIVASGSASELLSAEFGTVLTGRHLDLHMFPLSFREFLLFNGLKIESELDAISKKNEIKHMLTKYLEHGGFPKVALVEDVENKRALLKTYFNDIVSKDVVNRYKVKEIDKLEELAIYYLSNISTLHSFNRITKFIGISNDTVERFSHYFSTAYLLFFVDKFSYSLKEQSKSPRKLYCIDTGLKNAVGFRFREELGKQIENVVFIELMRDGKSVYYWRDRYEHEVDFVIKDGLKITKLIQVCWDLEKPDTKNREIRALVKAREEFKINDCLVITWDYEGRDEENHFEYVPLWKWLIFKTPS